ncbi:ClpP/crotonase [Violaceomyces palustris]|uniref:ClpP/crotonase n=1 Tax=Violaceomyces palustris TaxID=1673888 RepID=A0ACD0NU72_9BASI|nr:ClpP/crotonase [Violaceomyces palustris]
MSLLQRSFRSFSTSSTNRIVNSVGISSSPGHNNLVALLGSRTTSKNAAWLQPFAALSQSLVTLTKLSETVQDPQPLDEHVRVISLNRPASKNAISVSLLDQLEGSIRKLKEEDRVSKVRAVLLRSTVPGAFCAGADLKERKTMSLAEVDEFLQKLRSVFTQLSNLPMPFLVCLDGLAMGGGLELALTADLRIAGPKADKLGLTETRLGIIPGAGGTTRMTRLIGASKSKELIFTARLLDSRQAQSMGFVEILAETDSSASKGQEAFEKGVELARAISKNGPLAVRAAKMAIDRGSKMEGETSLDYERQCYEMIINTEDRLEGLKSFSEKRQPIYQGK